MVDRAYLDICIEICTPMMPLGAYIEGCRCISHEAQILRSAQNECTAAQKDNVRGSEGCVPEQKDRAGKGSGVIFEETARQ